MQTWSLVIGSEVYPLPPHHVKEPTTWFHQGRILLGEHLNVSCFQFPASLAVVACHRRLDVARLITAHDRQQDAIENKRVVSR